MQPQLSRFLSLLLLLVGLFGITYGQANKSNQKDTANAKSFVAKMQEFAKTSALSSAADFETDKAEQVQEATLVEIKKNVQKAKLYLRTGLDTVAAKNELSLIAKYANLAGDGVFADKETPRTYRNLVSTQKLLNALLERCNLQKTKLDNHKKQLSQFKYQIDSLSKTKELFSFPKDSAKLSKYMQTLVVLAREVAPIDSVIDQSIMQTQSLQNQASLQAYSLENHLDEVTHFQQQMSDQLFHPELSYLWQSSEIFRPFGQIIDYSVQKSELILRFFTLSNVGILACALLLLLVCYSFVLSLKSAYRKEAAGQAVGKEHLIIRHPLLSAIFIIANLSQFLFNAPPFIFSLCFWLVAAIALTLLMRGYITRFWMYAWLGMLLLFVLSAIDNLILQASGSERWYMLILSVAGLILGFLIFKKGKREELKESLIVYAIGLMVVLEVFALIFNLLGSYNLAKSLLVAGYVNVIIAIMFLWMVRLINQGLQLAFNLYARQDKSLFFMNFDKVGQKAPILLYVLLVIGWLILFGRNFPAYAFIVEPVRNFFFDQRAIGSYTFSISSLILFFFVVSVSVVISKVVSFFAVDKRTFSKQDDKKGIGSWILLIRITIILLGLFLAFAAVGIPIDKIAIVLGALGVGIGFGLQSLVNNLVSGLVIAFEKPLNLEDEVEIAGKSGTVKSIGFRSSIISTFDGAEMVMPNGDLLNSHLINWSSGSSKRRTSVVLHIAHGANLKKVQQDILALLLADERILKHPEPTVFFKDISPEALEMQVFYWSRQTKQLAEIKSDVIVAINQLFIKNDIQIPYPKQEVFVHPAELKKNKT
ncbi:mechanosensitive ion channel family protein [Pedobacter nanyangensis]|uniref:mechanosensitive ion channel family protein n=1 Tax=Pedobacter nanyangensis TaxID=1562389 RepID=UPI000DE2C91C|nr:mechanosensitive ion channel domain-containing protein [Pedobacter nanyangensis]